MSPEPTKLAHESGAVELDIERRELLVHGQPATIGGRAFDIIELLVRSAGKSVSKNAIMARVWPGAVVSDNALEVHISALRKALGESRGLLRTAYGRGYRLLGSWTLQGMEEARPPVLATLDQARSPATLTNLPFASGLIGRDTAAATVVSLLDEKRFVTLVGTGGIGKTRLAFEVARRMLPMFDDGVWLVELGSLSDPSRVPGAVAVVLGVDIAGSTSPIDRIVQALRPKRLLLVLDTCEHLVEAAARITEAVLGAGAGIGVLATSREALRAEGEHLYRVPPLSVPAEDTPVEQMAHHGSVQLFLTRATAAEPNFPRDEASMAICAQFCRRLDGIPLAIELAAARAATLGMEGPAAALDNRLSLLGRGRRTAVPRHRTLGATLDWSFGLLTETEQAALRRLSIFAGDFDIDAATYVVPGKDIDAGDVVEQVVQLLTKSLIVSEADGAARRYRLLDTTRAYAREKLGTGEERQNAARRHAEYCRDLLEQAEAEWGLRPGSQWLATYGPRIDDVRAALDWAFSPGGDAMIGAELAVLSAPLWFQLSLAQAGTTRFEQALALIEGMSTGAENARARMYLNAALGWLGAFQTAAVARRERAWMTTVELARTLSDTSYEVLGLGSLCSSHLANGEFRDMSSLVQEFWAAAAKSDDPLDLAHAERTVAHLTYLSGRHDEARAIYERLLRQPECRIGAPRVARYQYDHRAAVRIAYARILWVQGFAERALVEAEENVRETSAVDYLQSFWGVLIGAALTVAYLSGDFAAVDRYAAMLRPLVVDDRMALRRGFVEWLDGVIAIKRGEVERGLPLLRAGLMNSRMPGKRAHLVFMLGQTAEALTWAGLLGEAMSTVEEGLELQERAGPIWHLPELLRIKGHVLLMQGQDVPMAEKCFEGAIALAREHGALAWELRAASSLARLHHNQGRSALAWDVLAPVYERFTEGFATADLQQAKTLLETLRP